MTALACSRPSTSTARDLDALVHFAGTWPTDERERLAASILCAERSAGAPPVPRGAGKPWVCHRQTYGAGRVIYTTTRLGRRDAFVASSLDRLLHSIHRAA